ncbi:MAG: hypothetical protein ACOCVN_01130 [bacterium]
MNNDSKFINKNGIINSSCCSKLSNHDYLKDLPYDQLSGDLVEINFKNTRKDIYRNTQQVKFKLC